MDRHLVSRTISEISITLLQKRLPIIEFNERWPLVRPGHHKKGEQPRTIASIDDFAELKERNIIDICNSANIITKDMHRILVEKLGRRNSAAHPSNVILGQVQVEAYIDDLVLNVVLKLK